jgi:antitoxin component of MazEF toxin-antitoxin module
VIKTKLIRIGDSVAVVIDESFVEQFGLDENSEVDVLVKDGVLFITPDRDVVRRAKTSNMRE